MPVSVFLYVAVPSVYGFLVHHKNCIQFYRDTASPGSDRGAMAFISLFILRKCIYNYAYVRIFIVGCERRFPLICKWGIQYKNLDSLADWTGWFPCRDGAV
jgi:hypothetical protein